MVMELERRQPVVGALDASRPQRWTGGPTTRCHSFTIAQDQMQRAAPQRGELAALWGGDDVGAKVLHAHLSRGNGVLGRIRVEVLAVLGAAANSHSTFARSSLESPMNRMSSEYISLARPYTVDS